MDRRSSDYQKKIDLKVQKIIGLCTSVIIAYNLVFLFIDNDRSAFHLTILIIVAIFNFVIFFRNLKLENVSSSAFIYHIVNNFIFLPYVFLNGQGLKGFLPYFAIISCALPFYINRGKRGIYSASVTALIFSIAACVYVFAIESSVDKTSIYLLVSFMLAMMFIIIISRQFTILYLSLLKTLKNIAEIDDLTKVKTRRFMIDEVVLPKETAINKMGGYFSFFIIDIDNFKQINDVYGHKYGDFTLQAIASTLKCMVRKTDEVARFGGDEFMVFLDDVGVKESRDIAERIRTTISEIEIEGGIRTTISLGVVTVVRGHTKGYLRMADLCLIQAKEQGRNCVVSYEIDFDRTKRSKYEGM